MPKVGIKNKSGWLGLVLVIAIIVGASYSLFGGGYGVEVSCAEKQIMRIRSVPPPLMTAVGPPEHCVVDLNVSLNNNNICFMEHYSIKGEKDTIPCEGLSDFKDDSGLTVRARFYSSQDEFLAEDTKVASELQK